MIMTVDELKKYVNTEEKDSVLEAKLQALELLIRKYTNNNYQDRNRRFVAPVDAVTGFQYASELFKVGDTIQVSESRYNDGLYTIKAVDMDNGHIEVNEELVSEPVAMVTKVVYPMDIKLGVANMLSWDLNNRDKVGVQSETISRHSVTYFNKFPHGISKVTAWLFKAIHESEVLNMRGIGGNAVADIQVKSITRNEIGEQEAAWVSEDTLTGWLDLSGGDSKYTTYNAKVQESTHMFIADYKRLSDMIKAENSRMVVNGQVYDIMLIDDPMGMHEQLEIYLKYTGGQ